MMNDENKIMKKPNYSMPLNRLVKPKRRPKSSTKTVMGLKFQRKVNR